MSNEKYRDHYIVGEECTVAAAALYDETIKAKRNAVLQGLLDDTGAVAWRIRSPWGGADYVCDLVFKEGHESIDLPHTRVIERTTFEGVKVAAVMGKRNSKAGLAFNSHVDVVNTALEGLPCFTDWLILEHFKIGATGIGGAHPGGRGVSMLSTTGGYPPSRRDCLVFRIPNALCDGAETVAIPEGFTKITYGQFFDLVNAE